MNIGAPSTKAAKNRCSCATSHIAVRAPISGKSSGMSVRGGLRGHDQRAVHAALVMIGERAADLVFAFLEGDFEADGAARAEFFGMRLDARTLEVEVVRKAPVVAQHECDRAGSGADLARRQFVFLKRDLDLAARELRIFAVRVRGLRRRARRRCNRGSGASLNRGG